MKEFGGYRGPFLGKGRALFSVWERDEVTGGEFFFGYFSIPLLR